MVVGQEVFLRRTVPVQGTATDGFTWSAPGAGELDVRSPQELCDVMIGDHKFGNPPLKFAIAEGQYRVDISCAGDVVKSHYATVKAGTSEQAFIR